MKPVEFDGQNAVYAKDQPEYLPLPVHRYDDPCGRVTSCWELTFLERIKVLFGGKVWLQLMTFRGPLQPVYLTVKKEEVVPDEA